VETVAKEFGENEMKSKAKQRKQRIELKKEVLKKGLSNKIQSNGNGNGQLAWWFLMAPSQCPKNRKEM